MLGLYATFSLEKNVNAALRPGVPAAVLTNVWVRVSCPGFHGQLIRRQFYPFHHSLAARERFLDFVSWHGDGHAGAFFLKQHEDA